MRLRLDSPIDLAGDDTEDEDGDLELQRPAPLPRPRSAQQQQQEKPASASADAGRRSRKRSLERASRRESISSSDESDADSRSRRRTADDAGSGSGSGSGGTAGGFRPPTPVRILERKQKGLQFFVEPARLERMLNDVKPPSTRQTDRVDRQEEEASDHAAVSAACTLVCSQRFGRCEMRFRSDHVKLRVWKATDAGSEKPEWMGNVPYSQIARLCLSSGEPFMMLLEIEPAAKGYTPFAQFFDPLFAQWSQDHADTTNAQLYGAVFFFNEELDFARCRSIGDSIPGLQSFFQRAISEEEVRVFSKVDKNRGLCDREQQPRRETRWSTLAESAFSRVELTTMWAALSHWVEQDRITLGSSNLPDRHSALASSQPDQKALQADVKQPAKGESNGEVSHTDTVILSEEAKDDAETGPEEQQVIVLQTQDSSSSTDAVAPKTETDRRHQVVLLYPFDGADSLGRVSVTFGDITRLAPGEFLNDNIIDFYLRFLWRHSETWQKQQTYFFSSYFFSQLNASKAKLDRAPLTPQERHARVARWTQKETNLFDKRFLFIPINDSFHWSVAVFCNPGSAVVTKRRKRKPRPPDCRPPNGTKVIDVDDPFQSFRAQQKPDVANPTPGFRTLDLRPQSKEQPVEYDEVELEESRQQRTAFPPCILFLDSLRCHRKKKFSAMLREYLECEWNARYKSSPKEEHKREENQPDGTVDTPATIDDEDDNEQETFVTEFDGANISLIEPNIPLQSNSSDCGVFLLMYAAEVVRRFPCGVTSEDVDANLASSLSPTMFDTQHVREFRDYLHQLIFCLRSLQQRGLSETLINEEGLGVFSIE